MTNAEAIKELSYIADEMPSMECADWKEAISMAIEALEQEPCEDCISRQAVLDIATTIQTDDFSGNEIIEVVDVDDIKALPSVKPQELKTEQFAKWVATEIFDDMWEYNYEAFAEIACRKLAKLGIVTIMGDELVLVEQQESDEEE